MLGLLNSDVGLRAERHFGEGTPLIPDKTATTPARSTFVAATTAASKRQVADLLWRSTSGITELYYVRKDTARLNGITEGFEL